MTPRLTPAEIDYLRRQRIGRLATVDPGGAPQNNPVGYFLDDESGTLLVGGRSLGSTRKFKNVRRNPHVALVVDDLASVTPWTVRGVEIRGIAEALLDAEPPRPGMSREVIRISPTWLGSWGVDQASPELSTRS